MVYVIVYTLPSSSELFFIPVDNEKDLASAIAKLGGKGAVVKVYSTIPVNYKLKYKDKIETTVIKIPEIEILP